jgi:hypothetical protein
MTKHSTPGAHVFEERSLCALMPHSPRSREPNWFSITSTLTREWAYARPYDSSDHRASFLPLYLHDHNFHRPHSALHYLPPSSRLPKIADNLSRYNS